MHAAGMVAVRRVNVIVTRTHSDIQTDFTHLLEVFELDTEVRTCSILPWGGLVFGALGISRDVRNPAAGRQRGHAPMRHWIGWVWHFYSFTSSF